MAEYLVGVILKGPHPSPWVSGMDELLPEGTLVTAKPSGCDYHCHDGEFTWWVPGSALEILSPL